MKIFKLIQNNFYETNSKNVFIKLSVTGVLLSTLLDQSGCDIKSTKENLATIEPTASTDLIISSITPTPTVKPSPTLTPTPKPTPSPTPEIVLSPTEDLCRLRDEWDITSHQLSHDISLAFLEINGKRFVVLYEIGPVHEEPGSIGYSDYFTTKTIFIESEKAGMVPTEYIDEKAKWLSGESFRSYMIEILKMSEESAQRELAKIKKGEDLRKWYEKFVPKDQQIVISWEELLNLKDDYIPESNIMNKILELDVYKNGHKILV